MYVCVYIYTGEIISAGARRMDAPAKSRYGFVRVYACMCVCVCACVKKIALVTSYMRCVC